VFKLSPISSPVFVPAGLEAARVLVIGATSNRDSLDPALRRAGRFDREIGLSIPDRRARER